MKILSIETSCDETALAIVQASGDLNSPKFKIDGTALYSQIEKHREFGGVYPSLAKREHSKNLMPLLKELLNKQESANGKCEDLKEHENEIKEIFKREPELLSAFIETIPKIPRPDIDMIAVTSGPGLEPALWVGINFARALSLVWQIPVMPVNHMEGHISSVLISAEENSPAPDTKFPAISLLISGGHTELVLVKGWSDYQIIGRTKDDAVGEAYDKVARLLGLPYPGGPEISKLAEMAREKNLDTSDIKLPRPMIGTADFDFSFSGLKTAVLYLVKNLKKSGELSDETKQKVALEFENAITEVLIKKTSRALEKYNAETLIIGGGVIANKHLQSEFKKLDQIVLVPEMSLTTDNAVMIAVASFIQSFSKKAEINPDIHADGNLGLGVDKSYGYAILNTD